MTDVTEKCPACGMIHHGFSPALGCGLGQLRSFWRCRACSAPLVTLLRDGVGWVTEPMPLVTDDSAEAHRLRKLREYHDTLTSLGSVLFDPLINSIVQLTLSAPTTGDFYERVGSLGPRQNLTLDQALKQARQKVLADAAEGSTCPVCQRLVKIRRQSLHREMVVFLARLARCGNGGPEGAFFGSRDVYGEGAKASSDGTTLVHWGMIDREEGKKASYRITPHGRRFLLGASLVPRAVLLLNGKLMGFEEARCSVHDCYGERFTYGVTVV